MKKVITFILLLGVILSICSCNKMIDTTVKFDYAIVSFPDGTSKRIELAGWTDFEDGDQIQIKAKDGTVYLVHSEDCVLVRER